jgi:D-serine deaminase-like pyridoxal phosphate-dependent protein
MLYRWLLIFSTSLGWAVEQGTIMEKSVAVLEKEQIGQENSRFTISTPALILDLDAIEDNIQYMSTKAHEKGLHLRPHCKSHKCIKIAQLQVNAGALGVSCTTLGEAEVMAQGKVPGIHITSPIVSPGKIARLIALHQHNPDIMVVVDHPQNVQDLAQANTFNSSLRVLIDFDIGQNRTGVKSVDEALALANLILKYPTLQLVGIQAYGGHFQHIESYEERQRNVRAQNERIKKLRDHLQKLISYTLIITGGGTGTSDIDLNEGVYTELQVGSYLFMDVEYSNVALVPEGGSPFKPSLFVLSTVVSSHNNKTIIDAGLKAFATDGPKPRIFSGTSPNFAYTFRGDEHGEIFTDGAPLQISHVVEFLTPHCDPTVNLYDYYHCVRHNTLVDIWPIEARGLH